MKFSSVAIGSLALLLVVSCSGSRSFSKRGAKLDASGMYAEAADMYLQSAVRNAKNVDAKIGLKKTGQHVLNDKLSAFFKAFNMGSDKEAAVNAYLDAKDYQDRVQRAGVTLDIPDSYDADFKQVKGEYLVQLYTQGHALLDQKDYTTAETVFAKIGKLEPGYKDAGSLQEVAYLEPLYISGKAALDAGQYRKAYADLDKVVARSSTYKDAVALRQQCAEKGRYAIAVLPFSVAADRRRGHVAEAASLQAYATEALTGLNDPFLAVVDRDNIQKILDEQRLGMSGVVDEHTAVSAGRLVGAQAVIMGTVIAFEEDPGKLRSTIRNGYESYQEKQLDKETSQYVYVTKYKPVQYTEYYQENIATVSFSYKLVSLETGEVLMSKVIDQQASDRASYATYSGNANALFPVLNGNVNTAAAARRNLVGLLNGKRQVKSVAQLGTEALRSTSASMAAAIEQVLANKLP
jgi:curli biogenesis system outer membrane secretion channel CsgG